MALPVNQPNAITGIIRDGVRSLALELAICSQQKSVDVTSFKSRCISLSRGIDTAIATNVVPSGASELATILKSVCRRRNEQSLQAPITVLMVTVRNACNAQWFSGKESEELIALADEVISYFCTLDGFSSGKASIFPTASKILSRYYPWLKLGHILASVSIKPGFEACALDFHVSTTINRTEKDRVHLLVAMKDNIDTSSCIMNPQKVNILLNGVGIQGRVLGHMYPGPQLPTNVGSRLTYGTNLLQAIGHSDADYIVLIAFMSVIPLSDLPAPHDWVQPPAAALDSDAEIIEGSSKISLNCPISFTRIRQPVKGHLCKHLQCYDLSNYIEINTKRPAWRCPLCNQPVCYPDIRIDNKMMKILQEIDAGVTDVFIHSDGSWEANFGRNGHNGEANAEFFKGLQPEQQEASGLLIGPSNVCDLTVGDNEAFSLDVSAPEDSKAAVRLDLERSLYTNLSVPSVAGDPFQVYQNSVTQAQGIPCSDPLGNSCSPADYNTRENLAAGGANSAHVFGHFNPPVFTDSVSPAANREQQAFLGTNQQPYTPATVHPPVPNNSHLQQFLLGQMMTGGYGGYTMTGNVSRTPTFQARTVQIPSPSPLQSCGSSFMNNLPQNNSSLPLQTSYHEFNNLTQNNSSFALQTSLPQQQHILPSLLQRNSTAQMRGLNAPVQALSNGFRATPGVQAPQTQPVNNTRPQMAYTPLQLRPRMQVPAGGSGSMSNINQNASTSQQTRQGHMQASSSASLPFAPAQPMRTIQAQASMHIPSGCGGTIQRVSRTEDLVSVQNEQNWQPTGRMRGSIAGRAYNNARDAFMIRPTQQNPTPSSTGQPSNTTFLSPQLQAFLANRNLLSAQPGPSRNN